MLDQVDACIVHCIFRQMKMVNEHSHPDKGSVMNVMTQRIRDPELKDFIQESIDECFDILLTGGNVNGRCDFAKNLALCLEEKGKRHCEDWSEDMNSRGENRGDRGSSNQQRPPRQHPSSNRG